MCFPVSYFPVSPISVVNPRNRSTGTCESCWCSPKLCQKCDPVIHGRYSTVSLPLRHLLYKGFISFPILCKWPRCPVSRPITTDSCCRLMLSSLEALLCWGSSMMASEGFQSLLDFQHSMCFHQSQYLQCKVKDSTWYLTMRRRYVLNLQKSLKTKVRSLFYRFCAISKQGLRRLLSFLNFSYVLFIAIYIT